MSDTYLTGPAESPYHRTLPIGQRLSGQPLMDDRITSFEAVTLKELEPMLVPEEPRAGVLDPASCYQCNPSEHTVWADDLWQLRAGFVPFGLPFVGGFGPRHHWRLDNAPLDVLATLGPLMQRLSIALKEIPGVARAHFARWGDGSEHFHLWALARPAGMMQGRGAMLTFWDEVLPEIPTHMQAEHIEIVAESLAGGGGTVFPNR